STRASGRCRCTNARAWRRAATCWVSSGSSACGRMRRMSSLTPFLMFQGGVADEALAFYVATIPDSSIVSVKRYGPDGPGPEGTVMTGEAVLNGLRVMFSDSFVTHAFGFTPSLSLFVTCDADDDV